MQSEQLMIKLLGAVVVFQKDWPRLVGSRLVFPSHAEHSVNIRVCKASDSCCQYKWNSPQHHSIRVGIIHLEFIADYIPSRICAPCSVLSRNVS